MGWRYVNTNPIKIASRQFIVAVAEKGSPNTLIQINQKSKKAKVEKIYCSVLAYSEKWAKSLVTVELTLADKTLDIGWYELELVKQDVWKVSSINKVSPRTTGYSKRLSQDNKEAIEHIFIQYLSMVQKADYESSMKYLAGPAREAHEKYSKQLGLEPLINDFADLQSQVLWSNRQYAVIEFTYKVDGRKADVISGFYKTKQGWKLTTI